MVYFIISKDGTSFSNIPDGYKSKTSYLDNPDNLIVYTGESDGAGRFELIAVRPHAFSDDWSFERAHPADSKNNREAIIMNIFADRPCFTCRMAWYILPSQQSLQCW